MIFFGLTLSHLDFVGVCLPNRHRQEFCVLSTVEVLIRHVLDQSNSCIYVRERSREGREAIGSPLSCSEQQSLLAESWCGANADRYEKAIIQVSRASTAAVYAFS